MMESCSTKRCFYISVLVNGSSNSLIHNWTTFIVDLNVHYISFVEAQKTTPPNRYISSTLENRSLL